MQQRISSSPESGEKAEQRETHVMNDRKMLKFEHRGCAMLVIVTNMEGEWHSRFHLKCPRNAKQYTLAGREGPYASAEEAFEKAKQWARREIAELMESIPNSPNVVSRLSQPL
jgi:hypothetical protein